MAVRALFAMLCFVSCFTQQISRHFLNEQIKNESRYSRSQYFKIKESLSNIQPDGDGFRWCISRDRKYRQYIGQAASNACATEFTKNKWSGIQNSVLLLAGDIASNPGPIRSPCQICGNSVRRSEKGLNCILCRDWIHVQCTALSEDDFNKLTNCDLLEWSCDKCKETSVNDENVSVCEDMYDSFRTTLKGKGVKITHINCCGVRSKLTEIILLLKTCSIDILGITESHLNEKITDDEIYIEGYRFFRQDRQHKAGGGCLVYYKENLNVILKPEFMVNNIEALWMEITINSQRLLIGNVYRAPDNNEFYNEFKRILERLWLKRNNMLIMGDFNSDLLKTNKDKCHQGKKLEHIIKSFGLTNVIKEPTRIANSSATLLDLILVSNESKITKAGTIDPAISDHKMIFAIVNLIRKREPSNNENSKELQKRT
jgi:hypothetical protein